MSDISSEAEVVRPRPKVGHPVVIANLNQFRVKDDGQEYFHIDGVEYPARSVGVAYLRRHMRWRIQPCGI